MSKELNWLKKNRRYLNIKAIAEDSGVQPRTLSGFVSDQTDGHGTPFKVPEKYQKDLIKLIRKIQKS